MGQHTIPASAAFVLAAAVTSGAGCTPPGPPSPEPAKPEVNARPVAPHAGAPHWSYEGETGPASWVKLSPESSTTPIQLSSDQISTFTSLIKRNNRPVQPLNGRPIATDRMADVQPD